MDRRQFTKRATLTLVTAGLAGTAFKCGSEKVSIYVQTITTFLNQIAGILPVQAAAIAKIVKIASDFDAAYKRGDFASADSFLNSLEQNLSTFTADLGINVSNSVKTWLAIIGAALTSISVLLKEQLEAYPAAMAQARAAQSAGAVERRASQANVDKLYQAAKP